MNFQDMMDELKEEYLKDLPTKVELIRSHFKMSDISALRDDFHKLKGTGRTYGLPEVSHLGEITEEICLSHSQEQALKAIPMALALLEKIRACRLSGEAFRIEEEAEFQELQNL